MVENQSIKSIIIPEMGMRLGCTTECISLALYTHHRFFAECNATMTQYDVFGIGATCLWMASKKLEKPVDVHDIVNVLISTIHAIDNCSCIEPAQHEKWRNTIIKLEAFVSRNIGYKISYILVERQTPGFMFSSHSAASLSGGLQSNNSSTPSSMNGPSSSASLHQSSRPGSQYSGHRFLVHFLKSLNEWLNCTASCFKLNNIAWSYLSDFYWSSRVIHYRQDYLACAAIEMALKTLEIKIPFQEKAAKPWYKVFCEDLTEIQLDRIIVTMMDEYTKFDHLMELELTSCVIDSLRDETF